MKLTTGKFSKYLFEHIQVFNAVLSMFLLSKRHFIDFYSYPRHIIEVLKIRLLSKFQSLSSDSNVIFVEILGTNHLWRYQNIFYQILVILEINNLAKSVKVEERINMAPSRVKLVR